MRRDHAAKQIVESHALLSCPVLLMLSPCISGQQRPHGLGITAHSLSSGPPVQVRHA